MRSIHYIAIAGVALVLAGFPALKSSKETGNSDWPEASAEKRAVIAPFVEDIDDKFKSGDYGNIDRLMLIHKGEVMADLRYERDYRVIMADHDNTDRPFNYTSPDWHPYYKGTDLHTIQSITKSVTSMLVGIAVGRGQIPDVKTTQFIDYIDDRYALPKDRDLLGQVTLHNLLTMRMNQNWFESLPPPENSAVQLENSDNWIQFVLDQPMAGTPGERFNYNSGATQLLSAVMHKATGEDIAKYAEKNLFGPLGIKDYHWKMTPDGYSDTLGGLYFKTSDLAKMCQVMMDGGKWRGKQVLSQDWVEKSAHPFTEDTSPEGAFSHVEKKDLVGYSYKWWLPTSDFGAGALQGSGYGGQILLCLPDQDFILAINSWNPGLLKQPAKNVYKLLIEKLNTEILPALAD